MVLEVLLLRLRLTNRNVKLYARRVFITANCEVLKADWLNFVRGKVHSEDLPLNTLNVKLQQNKILHVLKKNLVKKCSEMLKDIGEKKDDYDEHGA